MSTVRTLRSITNLFDSGKHSRHQQQNAHATTLDSGSPSPATVKHRRLRKASHLHRSNSTLFDASVSARGTFTLQHHQSDHPLTEFRRRLARKASTFSLRTRRRQGERDQCEAAKEEEKLRELVLSGSDKGAVQSVQERSPNNCQADKSPQEEEKAVETQAGEAQERAATRNSSLTTVRVRDPTESPSVKQLPPLPTTADSAEKTLPLQEVIHQTQETYTTEEVVGGKTSVKKMASEQPQPPVPYTRLKEITEHACETALSGVTSYIHTDTEKWNTTIINSILGALVQETTQSPPAGSSAPAQPQFKYVVNSTIIQHAASSSSSSGDDPKRTSGRRGMHAASGAYWNNEKDGMWSFKYPGADSKGLDVVVGIIWVWVG
ncbi:hypothetical protein G647_05966 [Cladophialophora carrionii CBS 160.54]|uniref:Topoisomerase I damage affected protein 2 n=1 Tax=Cladophialophora carrionii CBS 160.54 TaxID=1279043 RepID=V9D5I4_9EURO|nr:uncharacterized protein G647_05966 [Cladophialophora carrionii CBS 160.54]ETI21896.1 hypothetical protein G647_05966 [Cladophialophora carrionii CBS 160.54]